MTTSDDERAGPGAAGQAEGDDALPRWRLIVAIGVTVLTIAAVVVGAMLVRAADSAGPVPVVTVDQPGATGAACTDLMTSLPDAPGGLPHREVAGPTAGVAAWGDPPVVLRCGLPTPAELTCSASLQVVDGVAWLQMSLPGQTTYLAVDRAVRIALTVPDGTGTGVIQDMSRAVAAALPARPVCEAGVLVPTENG